jgi:hypothetical protein
MCRIPLVREANMAKNRNEQNNNKALDAGRLETPIEATDPEIQEEFREAQRRAGSGSQILKRKLNEHTSTGPKLAGGDIDADWEDAECVGDEAASGDNPTPDQSVVDDIGAALGKEQRDERPLRASGNMPPRKT